MKFRLLLLLLTACYGCEWLAVEEQIPSFVSIESVKVNNPGGSGELTHDIRDLWVYLDGESLGVFPYPTNIPCLADQNLSDFKIIAGIRDNGIASQIAQYPMLAHVDYQLELVQGESYTLSPEFSYRSDVFIRFDEGFEQASHLFTFDADNNPATTMKFSSDVKRSGANSGYFELTVANPDVEIATETVYSNIPVDGSSVYLELDYLAEDNFFVGLMGYQNANTLTNPFKSYYLGLKASDEWKKIYVNLTEEFFNSGLESYRILFRSVKTVEKDEAKIYLDNIKLLHF